MEFFNPHTEFRQCFRHTWVRIDGPDFVVVEMGITSVDGEVCVSEGASSTVERIPVSVFAPLESDFYVDLKYVIPRREYRAERSNKLFPGRSRADRWNWVTEERPALNTLWITIDVSVTYRSEFFLRESQVREFTPNTEGFFNFGIDVFFLQGPRIFRNLIRQISDPPTTPCKRML